VISRRKKSRLKASQRTKISEKPGFYKRKNGFFDVCVGKPTDFGYLQGGLVPSKANLTNRSSRVSKN